MSNIKVSLGDIWVGIEDIRLLVASEWPIVRNREAVVTVSSGDEEYRLRNATDAVAALSKRAEKAEQERDAAIHDRNEAKALAHSRLKAEAHVCLSCEGPLTCARCTVSDQVLAEAERLDELTHAEADALKANDHGGGAMPGGQPVTGYGVGQQNPTCAGMGGQVRSRDTWPEMASRLRDLERKFAEHDTVFVNESERHRHEKHEMRIRDLERAVVRDDDPLIDFDEVKCGTFIANDDPTREKKPPFSSRLESLERAVEALKDGKSPAPFGPRYAGHCSDCGIGPAGAHLAGCSKGQPL